MTPAQVGNMLTPKTIVLSILTVGAVSQDLAPFRHEALPLGSIKTQGWLQDQLRLAGDGLAGNMFDFYRYVGKSTWMGGQDEYSDLRESATYWFNYIVPLAWTLDDDRLKEQAQTFLDYQIDNQWEDGWLGPEETRNERVIWGRSYLLLGMMQFAEADPSQTDRIVDSMHKYVALTQEMLSNNFTGLIPNPEEGDTFDQYLFGVARAHEYVMSLQWLLEFHPKENADVIREVIDLMFEGAVTGGRDWNEYFSDEKFPKEPLESYAGPDEGFSHGVNTAEALRYPTVLYRSTKDDGLIEKTHEAVDLLKAHHTSLAGSVIADEYLGGRHTYRGTELCMTVETMFSHAYLYRFHGTNEFADIAELAAFNALPAGVTADWWGHSYITQTNQPWATELETDDNPWYNVGNYGVVYGLEPNYPCCTVNHPQGYPKFAASLFARNGDNGLVHMLLSPAKVEAKIQDGDVSVTCNTNYPFSDQLSYTVESDVDFDFYIRIPAWTVKEKATITVDDGNSEPISPENDLQVVQVKSGSTRITITLPMEIKTVTRDNAVAFYRGPLLYAADIEHNETRFSPLEFSTLEPLPEDQLHPDAYDATFAPVAEWKFAVDPSTVKINKGDESGDLPNPVFVSDGPPTSLEVDAFPIEWPEKNGTAATPPINPDVDQSQKTTIKLIPYGAAKLHIAQFPVANLQK